MLWAKRQDLMTGRSVPGSLMMLRPTPKTAEAQRKAKARTTEPSPQDWDTVEQAKALIDAFEREVSVFDRERWRPFTSALNEVG